jgi:HD-GYP domain-containing protein (c-di-GMP phosphodiesterase class II)
LAELLAVLSFGADLGMGQPLEHVLRQSLIVLRLGDRVGMDDRDRGMLYHLSLLAWVGCHIDAYEQAKWFGDDLAMKGDYRMYDMAGVTQIGFTFRHLGAGRPLAERVRVGMAFMAGGWRDSDQMLMNHWYAADDLAARLGFDEHLRSGLAQTFERWDGKGTPGQVKGEAISLPARMVNLADVLEVFHRLGGVDAAVAVARERSGTQFDPGLVDIVCSDGAMLFSDLDTATSWDAVVDAEPALNSVLTDEQLDAALEAIADFIDVKSPFTLGHSRAVADLAEGAAHTLDLDAGTVRHVRRAALVHDLGKLGVSNAVWDKPGPLSATEMERVRLHPYLTERMLAQSPGLARLGATAVQHHERLDGSGYPRGVAGAGLSVAGRLLAVADVYQAKREERPHRPALSADEAAAYLRAEVRAGRLDAMSVDAVLRVAGHEVGRRQEWPAGLTAREVDVLRLLARGMSNSEIADRLVISAKTVGHHVEHIYLKIGVSNRARASLFAATHGLMSDASMST